MKGRTPSEKEFINDLKAAGCAMCRRRGIENHDVVMHNFGSRNQEGYSYHKIPACKACSLALICLDDPQFKLDLYHDALDRAKRIKAVNDLTAMDQEMGRYG